MIITAFIFFLISCVFTQDIHDPMINENLFEGDILGVDPNQDRSAIPLDSQRWPGGVIPYVVTVEVADKMTEIRKVIEHIERKTCIRFVPRTHEHAYLKIIKGEGNAVGFDHEHKRSDRDGYVTIYWENIPKKWHYAFEIFQPNQNRLLTEFDYDSIMLYGSTAFAIDPKRYTMTKKDGSYISEPHYKGSMSRLDEKRINMLYECNRNSS